MTSKGGSDVLVQHFYIQGIGFKSLAGGDSVSFSSENGLQGLNTMNVRKN
jgi:cold shock CspA family protein